jgi:Tfp pilus assembly protein PilE
MEHRNALEALRIEKDKAVLAEQQEKQERYGTLQDKYDTLMEKYSAAVGSSKQQYVKKSPRPFPKNGETKK